jgi:hypothetical protein
LNNCGSALWDRVVEIASDMPLGGKRPSAQLDNRNDSFFMRIGNRVAIGNNGRIGQKRDLSKNFVRNRASELFHILEGTYFSAASGDF